MQPAILVVQRRSSKAGAQTALVRLLTQGKVRALNPIVVTSESGWLTEQCSRNGIQHIIRNFPSSRSLLGRLFLNKIFVFHIHKELCGLGYKPNIVVGNDYLEGILTLELARKMDARSVVFLRSSEMLEQSLYKYKCHECNLMLPVGDDLYRKFSPSSVDGKIELMYDGLNKEELCEPMPIRESFPVRWLAVGSESHYKGWQDLAAAIDQLEADPEFPEVTIDFTGSAPVSPLNNMSLDRERRTKFNFIGRVRNLKNSAREYGLTLHTSREESIGLAAMEILAAGVPLLASRTGVIHKIQENEDLLFTPGDVRDLAWKISNLKENWTGIHFGFDKCKAKILDKFINENISAEFAHKMDVLGYSGDNRSFPN